MERTIVVDGETFVVRHYDNGSGIGTQFDWTSGPNPGYGFSAGRSDGLPIPEAEWGAAVRGFLAQVDPVTGYLE